MRPLTGNIIGAHQNIDRLARGSLRELLKDDAAFPSSKRILHFEGLNGPDAIKRKSPAKDEPWHYYYPFDEQDTRILENIGGHYDALVTALKARDDVRAAFEAAWLAHALVDGLTPPHHFPYEEKLVELRGGQGIETRTTVRAKIIMPGETARQKVKNNWKMWGPKGLLLAHGGFEWGVAFMLLPVRSKHVMLKPEDLAELHEFGVMGLFKRKAKEIAALDVYNRYLRDAWTPALARIVRKKIVPSIIAMVTLAWYAAAIDAGVAKGKQA